MLKNFSTLLIILVIIIGCNSNIKNNIKVVYPKTLKKPVIDKYFETKITDNYRWLEDDKSKETENWVKAEK